jgi:hypothetical protein
MSRLRSDRFFIRRGFLLMVSAVCVLGLTGCGSTIVTRVHSRNVLVRSSVGSSERQAWRIEKSAGILPKPRDLETDAHALLRWAGGDSDRLALAAEALLHTPARGSKRRLFARLAGTCLAEPSGIRRAFLQMASDGEHQAHRSRLQYATIPRSIALCRCKQTNSPVAFPNKTFGLHSV